MQQLQVAVETLTWMQQRITVEQHSLQRTVATVTTGKGGGNSNDSEVLQRTVALEGEIRQLKAAVETLRASHIDLQQAFQQHLLTVTPSTNPPQSDPEFVLVPRADSDAAAGETSDVQAP